ncbi:MAG TPA: hypothetical protein VI977_00605 [archaeon]|nr:hypothetical protein [archaeon]
MFSKKIIVFCIVLFALILAGCAQNPVTQNPVTQNPAAEFNKNNCDKLNSLYGSFSGTICAQELADNFANALEQLEQAGHKDWAGNIQSLAAQKGIINYSCDSSNLENGVQLSLNTLCAYNEKCVQDKNTATCQKTGENESAETSAECTTVSGEKGLTGEAALPKVRFYWNWGEAENQLPENACESIYCDPVQFTITLMKKLHNILGDSNPQVNSFTANIIGDSFNSSFLQDFAGEQEFVEAPSWFDSGTAALGKYLLQDKIKFSPENISSGKYNVTVEINGDNEMNGFLFTNTGEPNATITVKLEKVSDPEEQNPFYFLPINGNIGTANGRQGYGTKFDNTGTPILISGEYSTKSNTGSKTVSANTINDFETLNAGDTRSLVLQIANKAETIDFYPSNPVQALGVFNPSTATAGLSFKLLSNEQDFVPSTENATTWQAFGSEQDCIDSEGNALPYFDFDKKQESCSLGTGKSFLVAKSAGTYKTFYSTIFYVPQNQNLTLKTCSTGSVFATENATANDTQTIALETSPENSVSSIQSVFNLVAEKKICVITKNGATKFAWNERELSKEIQEKSQEFSETSLQTCSGAEAAECTLGSIEEFAPVQARVLSEELFNETANYLLDGSKKKDLTKTLLESQFQEGIAAETQQNVIDYLLATNPGLARNIAIAFNPAKDYGDCDTRKENPKSAAECWQTVLNVFDPSTEPVALSTDLFNELIDYSAANARNKGMAKNLFEKQLKLQGLDTAWQTGLVDYLKTRNRALALKVAKELKCGEAVAVEKAIKECTVETLSDFRPSAEKALSEELLQETANFLLEGFGRNKSLAIELSKEQYTAGISSETQQQTINYLVPINPGLARNIAIEFNPAKDYGDCDNRTENPKASAECGQTILNIFDAGTEPVALSAELFGELFNYLTENTRNKGMAKNLFEKQLRYGKLDIAFETELLNYLKTRNAGLALKIAKELGCVKAAQGTIEECTPAAAECQENVLKTCKEDGTGWIERECPNSCSNGACLECTTNAVVCTDLLNNKFKECNAEGAWSEEQRCTDVLANSSCATNTEGIQGCYLAECTEEKVAGGETGLEACTRKNNDLCKEAKTWEWFTVNKKNCNFKMPFWGGTAVCCKTTG